MLDLWVVLAGCSSTEEAPTLVVTHPDPLVIEELGPVALENVRLDDGALPHGLVCHVARPEVARFQDGHVVAMGPGMSDVVCRWEDQDVQFRLQVELVTMLSFDEAPEGLHVGESVRLEVKAQQGEDAVPLGPARWESSNADVLEVASGRVLARAPGVAFVTVRARGATAQVQISVAP